MGFLFFVKKAVRTSFKEIIDQYKNEKNIEAAEKAVDQMEKNPSQESVTAAQTAVKKVNDATQKQSLEARIQYIANYYGLTYEEDTTAVHQNQTDSNTDTGANTTDATIQSQQQQQYTPTVDAGTQTPSQTAQ